MLLISLILSFLPNRVSEKSTVKSEPTRQSTQTPKPTLRITEKPVQRQTNKAQSVSLQEKVFRGIVRAKATTDIVFDFPITIKNIFCEEGKPYFKKASLMTIDMSWYDEKISLKELELDQKEIELKNLQNNQTKKAQVEKAIIKIKNEIKLMKDKKNKVYLKGNTIICNYPKAIINGLTVAEGETIKPKTTLMKLYSLEKVYVEVKVEKEVLQEISKGMKVSIIDKTINKGYEGYVANKSRTQFFLLLNRENEYLFPESEVEVIFKSNNLPYNIKSRG